MLTNVAEGCDVRALSCPTCGAAGTLTLHGRYARHLATCLGERLLSVRRAICGACGRTHALLPPGAVPRSPYSAGVHALVSSARRLGITNSQVRALLAIPETTRRRILAAAPGPKPTQIGGIAEGAAAPSIGPGGHAAYGGRSAPPGTMGEPAWESRGGRSPTRTGG